MKILHIIPRYLPAVGGAEIHMAELSQRLAAAGHEVTVATSNALDFEYLWDPNKRKVETKDEHLSGVNVKRFPVRHLPLAPKSYHGVRRLLWLSRIGALSRLAPHLVGLDAFLAKEAGNYDLIGGMNIAYEGVMGSGLRAAQKHNRPFVAYPLTHLGAGDRPGSDPQSQFYTMPHQQKIVCASDRLIAQTETEKAFYANAGMSADRIIVAGPGLTPESVQGDDGEAWRQKHQIFGTIIACVCTLTRDKGVLELLAAMEGLKDQSVTLVLAGGATDEIKPLLSAAEAEHSNVLVLGRISDEEKRDLLAACDIFAMPSRIDSFGIAYLEAWANGKPVVGANAWGIGDVITDGEDGMLAPFGDVAVLEAKLRILLDHPAERVRLGGNGYQKLTQQHTWQHKFELVEQAYQAVIAVVKGEAR